MLTTETHTNYWTTESNLKEVQFNTHIKNKNLIEINIALLRPVMGLHSSTLRLTIHNDSQHATIYLNGKASYQFDTKETQKIFRYWKQIYQKEAKSI